MLETEYLSDYKTYTSQEINKECIERIKGFHEIWADIFGIAKEAHNQFLAQQREYKKLQGKMEDLQKLYQSLEYK